MPSFTLQCALASAGFICVCLVYIFPLLIKKDRVLFPKLTTMVALQPHPFEQETPLPLPPRGLVLL